MSTTAPSSGGSAEANRLTPGSRRAALAGGLGTLIEYYDFSLYGFLAVIIAPLFFPAVDPTASVLAALLVFAGGYLARPLGGWYFGRIGDRRGRRTALFATVIAMGVSCVVLGLLPTYEQVGVLAPILLVLVRLAQGFSAGGELAGAATYVAESAPSGRRGLLGSVNPIGTTLGFALAAAVAGATTALVPDGAMATWGWRIPFLICLPLAVLCLWARLRLEDTDEFREMVARNEVVKAPLRAALTARRAAILQVIGIAVAMNGAAYIGLTYMSVYLIGDLGLDPRSVLWTSALVIALSALTMPFAGLLADRYGRRPVLTGGLLGFLILSYPALALMGTAGDSLVVVALAFLLFMLPHGFLQVPALPVFSELFPRRFRYTGMALGFNIGTIVAGGTAPYFAAQLVAWTGDGRSAAYWVMAVSVLGLITVATLRETARDPLPTV